METPPPDVDDTADQLAVDEVLADLRWERRPPSGADVLVVADRYQGRAIAYRQAQFVHETTSGSGGHRNAKAAFSTAAAARRFLLTDLRGVFQGRAGMRRLGSDRLAPAARSRKGPPGWSSAGLAAAPPSRRTTRGASSY